jgi:ASC-1-like (ASCH) protein
MVPVDTASHSSLSSFSSLPSTVESSHHHHHHSKRKLEAEPEDRKKSKIEKPEAPKEQPRFSPLHQITLRKKYIYQIRNGQKTVEGRINTGVFSYCKVGDRMRFFYFQDSKDDVVCYITRINKYDSFRDMLSHEGYEKCVFEATSLEDAVRIYDAIPSYTEKAKQFGVVALQLSLKK